MNKIKVSITIIVSLSSSLCGVYTLYGGDITNGVLWLIFGELVDLPYRLRSGL